MSKPTTLPQWDSNGSNNIVAPSSGLKTDGYNTGATPTSGNTNWLFYWIYQWILWMDGLLTSGGGFTALVNQSITVSGTGTFKHGDQIKTVSSFAGVRDYLDTAWSFDTAGFKSRDSSGTALLITPTFAVGDRVKVIKVALHGDATVDGAIEVWEVTTAGVKNVLAPTAVTLTNVPASWADTTITLTTPLAITDSNSLVVYFSANAASLKISNLRFTYDRP